MSRIGKKPVVIPKGVKVEQRGQHIKVGGPLGSMEMDCHPQIQVKVDSSGETIEVINERPQVRQCRELHGTMRALLCNMVTGVSKGFEKKMMIYGTGYGVKEKGDKLVLQVGFSHPIEIAKPKAVIVNIEVASTRGDDVPSRFTLSSFDKALLGQFAANIRKIRPPEPYKGKGIRYADEHIKRKVGKAFASSSA